MIIRDDMGLVTINEDLIPWDKTEGGEVLEVSEYPRTVITDLVLSRYRPDDGTRALAELVQRVGRSATVTMAHLRSHGDPTGHGLVYEGHLVRVTPGAYNANSTTPTRDTIVLRPRRLYALEA